MHTRLNRALPTLGRFLRENRAVSAIEYALLVGVAIAGIFGAVQLLKNTIVDKINDAQQAVSTNVTF